MFATFGILEQIFSDNGTQFVSEEFPALVNSNGIRHITSAPYHPATNAPAERAVQTFKQALQLAIIISYPTSASGIIVLLKTPPRN